MGGVVVKARAKDFAVVAALETLIFGPRSWGRDSVIQTLQAPGVICFLVRGSGGDVLGFTICRNAAGEAEILTIGVLDRARQSGLGRSLLAAACDEASKHGAVEIFLDVDAQNAPALALYSAAGFQKVGERAKYYRDGADAIILAYQFER